MLDTRQQIVVDVLIVVHHTIGVHIDGLVHLFLPREHIVQNANEGTLMCDHVRELWMTHVVVDPFLDLLCGECCHIDGAGASP
ncbi:hypothetical protein SAMD00019534_013510, partial [Acytostelium subglobosum LB1]|uniref:hypothetical protein n=1 Tax=Acytostelium subglobosum LB1 TaxID=1410327 RepID=UPI0006450A9F